MSTIPFNQVVRIIPDVLAAAGSAVDLNAIMLTKNLLAPNEALLEFSSALDVGTRFGSNSDEYKAAVVYFNGYDGSTKKPGTLYVLFYPEGESPAMLISSSFSGVTIAELEAFPVENLSIRVNGTVYVSDPIDFTEIGSFSDAATYIESAFTSPPFTVTWNSTVSKFIFTTILTGASATIDFPTSPTGGADYLNQIGLSASVGATIAQGADAAVPATFMNNVLDITQNWATLFTLWELDLEVKKEFASWVNSQGNRYFYACQDSDTNAIVPNSTTTFASWLDVNEVSGTCAIYGDETHASFVAGYAASLDFERLNGRTTLDFRSQSGLEPTVTNGSQATTLTNNGYNFYGRYGSNNPANNQNWISNGSVSGEFKWADSYLNQVWLNANLQLAFVTLLRSVGSVPYNAQGNGLLNSAALDPIEAAKNFGAIRTGVLLSNSQKAQIQLAIGKDVSAAIYANGFYLQIGVASPSVRAERGSPPMTLYYTDGGSVQQITMPSILIQ